MSELVRVAIGEDFPEIQWPACCPECGTTKSLIRSTSRLGKVKSVRPNLLGGLTMKSQVMYLNYWICPEHAAETRWANRLLDKSPLMHLIRFFFYTSAFFALGLLLGPRKLQTFPELGFMLVLPFIGIVGVVSLIWARMATSVWPVRFDPDQDVIEIRFRQAPYATRFRVMNREATSLQNTEALPWYQRGLIWKIVVIAMFLTFMSQMMRR